MAANCTNDGNQPAKSVVNAPNSSKKEPGDSIIISLGRQLFYNTNLSVNGTKSCASCHNPDFAFSDGYRTSITCQGENVLHNAPSLVNVYLQQYFDWANPGVTNLKQQIQRPLYNQHPVELGFDINLPQLKNALYKDSTLMKLYYSAYHTTGLDPGKIEDAIIAFTSSLISFNSDFDKYINGDSNALSVEAKQGYRLFKSQKLQCASCHPPPLFTLNSASLIKPADSIYFNTGLYNVDRKGGYPETDQGIFEKTDKKNDIGKFKIPSLRNVALTAPYMHDGSVRTLDEVIRLYERGGRLTSTGPYAGDGKNNPYKDGRISGFKLTDPERKQVLAFLYSLTDSTISSNSSFTSPYLIQK